MNRHTHLLTPQNSLLVIVDMQIRLTEVMPVTDASLMLTHTDRLIKAAMALEVPVLVTEQNPKGLGSTVADITDSLPQETPIFPKTGFSCCAAEGFCEILEQIQRNQIILVGQETHVCILQSALDLLSRSYQIHIVEDGVCSRKAEHKSNALARMQRLGITITNHESVLFEWLGDYNHPDFKTIAKLLR